MASAFVTGGSGFIGGHLIRRLVRDGHFVRALSRSDSSDAKAAGAGATPVRGDLGDSGSIRDGAEGCELAFHCAAAVAEWGPWEEFERGNVLGTENALMGAREAGVRRFVHVGTEAALMAGQPLVNVNEETPLRPDSKAPYCATKAKAEQLVRSANGDGFETVVVRPRLVWGVGDTTILPSIVDAVKSGRWRWLDGGRHRTDSTHVDNVIEGLVLGAERGTPGEAYFVTDGDTLEFRDFITRLVATQGIEIPDKSTPAAVGRAAAPVLEALWHGLRRNSPPPLTRTALWLASLECTIDISKARTELGYSPVRSVEAGLEELRASRA